MDRYYFHWGATAEIMEIIRRRRKSPEFLRLVERTLDICRPGTMRRKVDMNAQFKFGSHQDQTKEAARKLRRSTANY